MPTGDLPLVSIGVLTYNRKEDVRRTLDVLAHGIDYPSYEVIVLDNASTDGTTEMVRDEYPDVRIHPVGANLGMPARNLLATLASGKYIFSYDDDSQPATPSTILGVVEFMEANPEVAVAGTCCYRHLNGFVETSGWEFYRFEEEAGKGYRGLFLVEGGSCFRTSELQKVQGYEPAFVRSREGADLCLQFYRTGSQMWFCPQFATLHWLSNVQRSSYWILFYESRHTIWTFAKHWRAIFLPVLVSFWILRKILTIAMHPNLTVPITKGIFVGLIGMRPYLAHKPKLSLRQTLGLRRFYLNLFRW
jgi:GT2 family glycosyltransferase